MPKVLVFAKRGDSAASQSAETFKEWLTSKKIEPVDVSEDETKISQATTQNCVCGVVFGGDGTFLTLVRLLERKDNLPLVGVNQGTLGFITEIHEDEVQSVVEELVSGKAVEELKPLYDVSLIRGGKTVESGTVFNDAFVTKDARTSLLTFDVRVDKKFLTHIRADGFIVASPTGSTGYALSAGAPLVHPSLRGLVTIPICAHTLYSRPIILPDNFQVEIEIKRFDGKSFLCLDGQINVEVNVGDVISIRKADTQLRLVKSPERGWGEALRDKLKMG